MAAASWSWLTPSCTPAEAAASASRTPWSTWPDGASTDVGLNVDVKHVGCEAVLLDGLQTRAPAGPLAALLPCPGGADRLCEREPRARLGISVGGRRPALSRRWGDWRAQVLSGLASRRWEALMAQHRLVDASAARARSSTARRPSLRLDRQRARGDQVAGAWLGVHGITTADPRLFTPARCWPRGERDHTGPGRGAGARPPGDGAGRPPRAPLLPRPRQDL